MRLEEEYFAAVVSGNMRDALPESYWGEKPQLYGTSFILFIQLLHAFKNLWAVSSSSVTGQDAASISDSYVHVMSVISC